MGYIDSSVVLQYSFFAADPSLVVEGHGNAVVPQVFLSCGFFDLLVYFTRHGHDKGSEVCRLENGDIAVILVSLVMVLASGKQVGFYVLGTRLVVKREVVIC